MVRRSFEFARHLPIETHFVSQQLALQPYIRRKYDYMRDKQREYKMEKLKRF